GGTATSLASILQELDPYDPNKVDGYAIDVQTLMRLNDKLFSLSVEQRRELKGLQKERAEVIAGGCAVTLAILTMVGVDKITVSEKDNLEGYLMKRLENYE
ncbi:MAG: Ppx/GppA family phosphatase, partial [Clostridia bacterium]|nr:Ppx/GppA family phosphatase [Clostridia bacterium]